MGRKAGTKHVSVTADSARPGGPSTMDVLVAWITKPGNVKRWRSEPHAPLIREIVDKMHGEGLVHRKAPFVRYKVDAIEKQYLLAKQWLLETGMHDAFMRGKGTPEVRAHVERTCPLFRKLDPAFHGVPFSKKNAETIELDDSAEDGESVEESKQEIEVPDDSEEDEEDEDGEDGDDDDSEGDEDEDEGSSSDSDSDGAESEEVYDGEEGEEEDEDEEEAATKKGKKKAPAAEAASQKASTPSRFKELLMAKTAEAEKEASEPKKMKKKATLNQKALAKTPEKAKAVVKEKKKAPTSVEKQKKTKKVVVSKERVLLKVDEKKTKKKAVASKSLKVTAKEKSPAESQKKAGTAETRASAAAAAAKVAEQKKADTAETRASTTATKVAEKKMTSKPAEPQEEKKTSKAKEAPVLSSAVEAALEQVAPAKSKPDAVESTPEPVKKRRGRPPKSATAASPATNGTKETAPKANGKKPPKASGTKRKAPEEETVAVKTTRTQQKEAETATKRARTQQQGEESAANRARTQEQEEAERKTMVEIEREALLKRVEDEQKQRHDVYELERSKLQCELAAKQVQLLFEKATARKKLDQLGVPQEEIDRLLPL